MSRPARQPLRLRLTVLVVGLCVLVLAVTGSATLVVLIGSLHQRVDAQLATTVSGLRALATIEHDLPGRLIPPERTSFGSLYLAVLEPGRTPRGPGPALALPLPVPGELVTVPGTGPGAARSYRVMTTLLAGGHVGVIGLSLDETEDAVHAMVAVVVIVEVLGVTILGLLSAWIVRRELRPLESSARTADLIAAGDLTHRLSRSGEPPLSTRTEVGRLAAALDRMLDQIQAAFEARDTSEGRLRQFVADASHELRTPLQSIRAYAELYLSDALPDAAAEREAVERMHAEARRMARLVQAATTRPLRPRARDRLPGLRPDQRRPGLLPRLRRGRARAAADLGHPRTHHTRRRRGAAQPTRRQPARQRTHAHAPRRLLPP